MHGMACLYAFVPLCRLSLCYVSLSFLCQHRLHIQPAFPQIHSTHLLPDFPSMLVHLTSSPPQQPQQVMRPSFYPFAVNSLLYQRLYMSISPRGSLTIKTSTVDRLFLACFIKRVALRAISLTFWRILRQYFSHFSLRILYEQHFSKLLIYIYPLTKRGASFLTSLSLLTKRVSHRSTISLSLTKKLCCSISR